MIDPRAPIRDFMTPAPVTIGRQQTMAEAARRMQAHRVRHLPVLDGGRVVGIVSERDLALVEGAPDVDPAVVLVEEAMTGDPRIVAPEAPILAVVELLAEHKYGATIVVDDHRPIGIFTTIDALLAFARLLRGE